MRAVYYERTGPADEVLTFGDVPTPTAGPGEVLVRVMASGINPADVKRRAGWGGMEMAHPKVIPHCDGAGTIEAVGAGVDVSRVGQPVWLWNAQGGYGEVGRAGGTAAEFIALPEAQAVPLPDHYTMSEGACLGVPAMTAHRCVMSDGPIAGHTILVQGGAGAVGYLALQIAKMEGARLITTISSSDNADRMRAIGVEPVDRYSEDLMARLLDLTNGEAFDRVIEVDFAANQKTDTQLIKPNGTIASYSSTSDPKPRLDYYALASKGANLRFIQGFALPEESRHQGVEWLSKNRLEIPIAETFSLDDCATAHSLVEKSRTFGQAVLAI